MLKTIKALLPLILTVAITISFVINLAVQSSNFNPGLVKHLTQSQR